MSRISPTKRAKSIKIDQKRGKKLRQFREKYAKADTDKRDDIWEKVEKISLGLDRKEFEARIKN